MSESKAVVQRARLDQLDGIKGIICFFIIFVHYYGRTPSGKFPLSFMPDVLTRRGWMFVELFFIISGFVCALSYKNKIKDMHFGKYLGDRIKRLYPSVILITLFDVLVRVVGILATGDSYRLNVFNLIKSLTFATTLVYNEEPFPTVIWYIHVLFLCYLVYFFIAKQKTQTRYILSVISLLIVGWVLYSQRIEFPFLYRNIGRGYLAFSVGVLICEFQSSASKKAKRIVSWVLFAISAFTLGLSYFSTFEAVYGDFLFALTTLLFPTLLICALNIKPIEKIFASTPFVFFGKLSMAIFLVHVPILNLFNIIYYKTGFLNLDKIGVFAVAMLTILAVSLLWYYLIEKRLIPKVLSKFPRG